MSLRDAFALLDADGSGELDADEFIQGILREFDGQFTAAQVQRLIELTDVDNSGECIDGARSRLRAAPCCSLLTLARFHLRC